MKTYFDHERFYVCQESIAFCGWVGDLLNEVAAKAAAKDQLDRASTSRVSTIIITSTSRNTNRYG